MRTWHQVQIHQIQQETHPSWAYTNALTLGLTARLGSAAHGPDLQHPSPLLLPSLPSFTGSVKAFHAELLSLDLFGARAGAGGLSHCSCPVFVAQDQTGAQLALSRCHWGRVPRSVKQGAGGCGDDVRGLQRDGLPRADPVRDAAWQPVAGRLLEAFLLCTLASRERNPVLPSLLDDASETTPPRCRGLGGNETRTGTAGDFTELHNDEFLRVVSMQTVFRVYRKVNISIRWSPISSGPWRLWPNVSPEHSSQTKYMPLLKYWTVWPN